MRFQIVGLCCRLALLTGFLCISSGRPRSCVTVPHYTAGRTTNLEHAKVTGFDCLYPSSTAWLWLFVHHTSQFFWQILSQAIHSQIQPKLFVQSRYPLVLNSERTAERPCSIIRGCAVMIYKDTSISEISKEGTTEFSYLSRCSHPARSFRIEISKSL